VTRPLELTEFYDRRALGSVSMGLPRELIQRGCHAFIRSRQQVSVAVENDGDR